MKLTEDILFGDEVYKIAGCAMSVINILGNGFSEKVYENALAVEFKEKEITFKQQEAFNINYKNENVGTYIPDFVVYEKIIIELKTIDRIGNSERGQVLNYLKGTGLRLGLIINFKHSKLEWERIIL